MIAQCSNAQLLMKLGIHRYLHGTVGQCGKMLLFMYYFPWTNHYDPNPPFFRAYILIDRNDPSFLNVYQRLPTLKHWEMYRHINEIDYDILLYHFKTTSYISLISSTLRTRTRIISSGQLFRIVFRGLPLIMYASRGGGGVNTNAYKCVQGGRGGLNMTKNTHFVRRFI